MSRFFIEDSPELAGKLIDHLERIRKSLEVAPVTDVESLILGGGYGRGEGGVFTSKDGSQEFFNDLDYFLFCSNPNDPALAKWVQWTEKDESEILGIDVEIQCLPPSALTNPSESMMFYDLVAGHEIAYGPKDYMDAFSEDLDPSRIKLEEATRLLWNRGTGLYFARQAIHRKKPDLSFAHRNISKCKLAMGDALLVSQGLYHFKAAERGKRLKAIRSEIDPRILPAHNEGVEFKSKPSAAPSDPEELLAEWERVRVLWKDTFLRIERKRLNVAFKNLVDYSAYPGRLYPKHGRARSFILATRDRLKRGGMLKPMLDYPRGALMRALACQLSDGTSGEKKAVLRKCLPTNNARNPDHDSWKSIYEKWWQLYS